MKTIKIETILQVFDGINELPNQIQELMQKAIEARENSYAPYSRFKVGAAILLDNKEIVIGNNQENAAYPSGICAERVAIFQSGAAFPNDKVLQIAITARSEDYLLNTPTPPCGGCRQAIAEYKTKQKQPIEIYFMGETGKVMKSDSINALLPFGFDATFL